MKIAVIQAGIPECDGKLRHVSDIMADTLKELDQGEIDMIRLSDMDIPFYHGGNAGEPLIASIVQRLREAKGIVFAAGAGAFAPSALMLALLEHLGDHCHSGALADKSCLIVATSEQGGERAGAETLSGMIGALGGYDAGRIMIGSSYFANEEADTESREIVERQTEDFYRIIRQNRKFFIPAHISGLSAAKSVKKQEQKIEPMTMEQIQELFGEEHKPRYRTQDIYQKYSKQAENEAVQGDLDELTQFFAQKYSTDEGEEKLISKGPKNVDIDYSSLKPRTKTCRQITQSLPHYFKPQYADGLNVAIQLLIQGTDGQESFEGYLQIADGECCFESGLCEHNDLTILAEEKAWLDVVKGKHTAQKAFMIGQIKVRGNFLYLSRLDQIFDFSMAIL